MKIKAVLLDVGGPILDEDHEYGAWDSYLLRLLAEEGMKVGRERLLRTIAEATERCAPHPRVSALWALARPDVGRFRRLKDALREFQRRHIAEEYALCSDWDDNWRQGGSVDEVCEDAHIDPTSIAEGVVRFARDYEQRLSRLQAMVGAASGN